MRNVTLLAPVDAAFYNLSAPLRSALHANASTPLAEADSAAMAHVLRYHILRGYYTFPELPARHNGRLATLLPGRSVRFAAGASVPRAGFANFSLLDDYGGAARVYLDLANVYKDGALAVQAIDAVLAPDLAFSPLAVEAPLRGHGPLAANSVLRTPPAPAQMRFRGLPPPQRAPPPPREARRNGTLHALPPSPAAPPPQPPQPPLAPVAAPAPAPILVNPPASCLQGGPSNNAGRPCHKADSHGHSHPLALVLGCVVGSAATLILIGGALYCCGFRVKRPKAAALLPMGPSTSHLSGGVSFSRHLAADHHLSNGQDDFDTTCGTFSFTYEELQEATGGFASVNVLGEGGFGRVYRGCIGDSREVAVKQLIKGGGQGEREFRAEVEIISRVHHRHLVSLLGYCICRDQRLLVYNYVPNGTLESHLHGDGEPMDWPTRMKVALGAAEGLAYLHEECEAPSARGLHTAARTCVSSGADLTATASCGSPQVADFGLAKLAEESFTHVSTRIMGTFGYVAPEYANSGKLTEKSDVYSFGVVLLELLTGLKPVDKRSLHTKEYLVDMARPYLREQRIEHFLDPLLGDTFRLAEVRRMMIAADMCVRYAAPTRPRMGQIVQILRGADLSKVLDSPDRSSEGSSNPAFSRQNSAMSYGAFSSELREAIAAAAAAASAAPSRRASSGPLPATVALPVDAGDGGGDSREHVRQLWDTVHAAAFEAGDGVSSEEHQRLNEEVLDVVTLGPDEASCGSDSTVAAAFPKQNGVCTDTGAGVGNGEMAGDGWRSGMGVRQASEQGLDEATEAGVPSSTTPPASEEAAAADMAAGVVPAMRRGAVVPKCTQLVLPLSQIEECRELSPVMQ
eukprot:SM000004S15124  [mRNA]  locus=s4:1356555:1360687:- [translate_table: standard]